MIGSVSSSGFSVLTWVLVWGAVIGVVPALFVLVGYDQARDDIAQSRQSEDGDDPSAGPDVGATASA